MQILLTHSTSVFLSSKGLDNELTALRLKRGGRRFLLALGFKLQLLILSTVSESQGHSENLHANSLLCEQLHMDVGLETAWEMEQRGGFVV